MTFRINLSPVLVIILFLAAFAGFTPLNAHAQELRVTESEKVGFAFHKLGNFDPKFETWIKQSKAYEKATPVEKTDLLQKDIFRLRNGYYRYMPDVDLIALDLEAQIYSSRYFSQNLDDDSVAKVRIKLKGMPNNYIPVQVGEYWIAIVLKDFDLESQISFNSTEYSEFVETFGLARKAYQSSQDIGIDILLRPVSVDTTTPIELDGLEMWLMLAETAELRLWRDLGRNGKDYFYDYAADWYVPESQRDLLRLYTR